MESPKAKTKRAWTPQRAVAVLLVIAGELLAGLIRALHAAAAALAIHPTPERPRSANL
jgi:hypothetical protein